MIIHLVHGKGLASLDSIENIKGLIKKINQEKPARFNLILPFYFYALQSRTARSFKDAPSCWDHHGW